MPRYDFVVSYEGSVEAANKDAAVEVAYDIVSDNVGCLNISVVEESEAEWLARGDAEESESLQDEAEESESLFPPICLWEQNEDGEKMMAGLKSVMARLSLTLESFEKEFKRANDLKEKELGIRCKDISQVTEEFVEGRRPVKFPGRD